MGRKHTTRRAVLGGAGLASVAMIAPAVAKPTAAQEDAAWSALYSEYVAAQAAAQRAIKLFCKAENKASLATQALTAPVPPKMDSRVDTSMSLAELIQLKPSPEEVAAKAVYDEAYQGYIASIKAIEADIIDDLEERWHAADVHAGALLSRMCQYPVRSLQGLQQKADLLVDRYGSEIEAGEALALVDDIRRLAKQEVR